MENKGSEAEERRRRKGSERDGNEERRERRTGGGEIISHRLAGAATVGAGGADPPLIIPSCLHLPAAPAYEQWAEPQSSGGDEGEQHRRRPGSPDWVRRGCKL